MLFFQQFISKLLGEFKDAQTAFRGIRVSQNLLQSQVPVFEYLVIQALNNLMSKASTKLIPFLPGLLALNQKAFSWSLSAYTFRR